MSSAEVQNRLSAVCGLGAPLTTRPELHMTGKGTFLNSIQWKRIHFEILKELMGVELPLGHLEMVEKCVTKCPSVAPDCDIDKTI
ncbi:hypothetical protein TNIN_250101 [Trichonephila inaurata madagascariensis]|uniref:Uncharacterized protein n=1 Tax=Trichonephila inaurata madagascariensis TaxID=2747483 RepID=A0A8X7C5M9_9ARAC|nr:hypothetical protein TNIN_250101 [Trichonephila inaurata madagascariensis]